MKTSRNTDRSRKTERSCERCGRSFVVAIRRLRAGRGRFCGYKCAALSRPRKTLLEAYELRVVRNVEGCWGWSGCRGTDGYGAVQTNNKRTPAHRASWELHNGPIPNGMLVLHRCDNPPCTRPDHLFLGTDKDNAKDRETKGRGTGTPENIRRMVLEMFCSGSTIPATAERLGISNNTARRVIIGSGIPTTRGRTLAFRKGVLLPGP